MIAAGTVPVNLKFFFQSTRRRWVVSRRPARGPPSFGPGTCFEQPFRPPAADSPLAEAYVLRVAWYRLSPSSGVASYSEHDEALKKH